MSEPLITECPGCHSRFRITEGQLNAASGQVRCGSCLRVFDARGESRQLELDLHTPSADSPQPPASPPPSAHQTFNADAIPHLYAEPILPDADPEIGDPVATAGWALASLAALALLVLQYAWFERASLARNPDLAPLYTLACESLPCDLSHNAIDQILNERMIVRPHPAFADALSVDLRLLNQAAFAQPFPALQLRFSDLKGNPVAQRTFQPQEYLSNETLDPARMPPGTPVELRLDITDPGVQALSYSLELKPAR